MFKSNHERRMRYSIRKFSVGVASVLVASFFMGSVAHAGEMSSSTPTNSAKVTEQTSSKSKAGENKETFSENNKKTEPARETLKDAKEKLIKELAESDLPTDKKAAYQQKIEQANDTESLLSIDNDFHLDLLEHHEKQHMEQERKEKENQSKDENKVVPPTKESSEQSHDTSTKENTGAVAEIQKRLKEEIRKSTLPTERKDSLIKEIEGEDDRDNLETLENSYRELEDTFKKINEELDHQKKLISDMATTKGITEEDKSSLVGEINKIKERIVNDFKNESDKSLQTIKQEVIADLGKLFKSYKAYVEKEIQNYVNEQVDENIKEKKLNKEEANEDATIKQLRELEKKALQQLDQAAKNEEVLKAKHSLLDEIAKLKSSNGNKETTKPRDKRSAKETDQQDLAKQISEANLSLSNHMSELLDRTKKDLKSEYESKFDELIKNALGIVNKYRSELSKAQTKEELNRILETAKSELNATVEEFKKGLTKSTEPQRKPDMEGHIPPTKDGKSQTPTEETKEIESLKNKAKEELKKLEQALAEVNNYPELPENNSDYKVQKKDIWEDSKKIAPDKIKAFREQLEKGSYTAKTLQTFIDDFIYYQIHAQIEKMTRQVALYREKYAKIPSLEKEFESGIKQTWNKNYATLEGKYLADYFKNEFLPSFNKIQQIVELQKAISQLEEEMKTVPDGAKLTGEAGSAYEKVRNRASEIIKQGKELLEQVNITEKQLDTQIGELQKSLSELKVAKANLVPKKEDKKEIPKPDLQPSPQPEGKKPHTPAQPGTEDKKPSTPKPDMQPSPQPEGKKPHTPAQPGTENQKPSAPKPDMQPSPQPEGKKPHTPAQPKTHKIFTAADGKTKVSVIFDKPTDADKLHLKEVTTKELADKIARKTGGGTVRVFDLSLSKGGKETHVNGERTVRLALGQTGSDVHVYHVKENGDLERIPSKVENGQVVFKTNHFSLFAIKTLSKNQNVTTPKQTKPSIQDSQTQIGESRTGKFQNKEVNHKSLATENETVAKGNPTSATEKKLPSTGVASNLVLEILGLLGLIGTSFIAMKRRK
ncbi:Gram-positive signal peptide protein, YSIRK family [Streptococcus sp. CM6]|uniref:GAG-binding domain-containing protein n=1 Tax=Streptococcus sp. CM6 TaxID=936580 RepID=UPI000448A174|nr:GAG-binding domain-containing protein [Streptococcus sp. CM6]EUC82268.1 Gram-positive signal peptide protein, YSIRK family [Streptococcus sp. CM6]